MKLGAYDYITKRFLRWRNCGCSCAAWLRKFRLVEENEFLRERMDSETAVHGIVGSSAKIQEVLRIASRLKDTRTAVLISGESGTGKNWSHAPFISAEHLPTVRLLQSDCGSLVPTLIESELFGYEKGAFTGALKSKPGLFSICRHWLGLPG